MGFLNKFFGFRWSLYIVQNENQLVYAMHENNVMGIIGYVIRYFANGGMPVAPWSLHLNFNHKHQAIKLGQEHFTPDGENVTPLLMHQIEAIDPGWKVNSVEPVFEVSATKKRIKILDHTPGHIDLQSMLDNIGKPRELTFYSVMDEVFGFSGEKASSIAPNSKTSSSDSDSVGVGYVLFSELMRTGQQAGHSHLNGKFWSWVEIELGNEIKEIGFDVAELIRTKVLYIEADEIERMSLSELDQIATELFQIARSEASG